VGMKTYLPVFLPVMISASISWLPRLITRSLVPFNNPLGGSKFLISVLGADTGRQSLCGGKPAGVNEFKNSVGQRYVSPGSDTLSALRYVCVSPAGKVCKTLSLIMSTSSFVRHSIALLSSIVVKSGKTDLMS